MPLILLKKGEFEKTVDFHKRSCDETFMVLGSHGEITFDLEKPDNLVTFGRCDADNEVFEISFGYIQTPFSQNINLHVASMDVPFEASLKPFYVALGLDVRRNDNLNFQVYLYSPVKFADSPAVMFDVAPKITLNAKPAYAKQISDDLRVAVTARIQSPCVEVESNYPVGLRLMAGEITEWIVYLASTKEVLKRGKFVI